MAPRDDRIPVSRGYKEAKYLVLHSPVPLSHGGPSLGHQGNRAGHGQEYGGACLVSYFVSFFFYFVCSPCRLKQKGPHKMAASSVMMYSCGACKEIFKTRDEVCHPLSLCIMCSVLHEGI